jgi:hypothetical protein
VELVVVVDLAAQAAQAVMAAKARMVIRWL